MPDVILTENDKDILKTYRVDHMWLGAVDLIDTGEVVVTIDKVLKYKDAVFEGGRKESGQALQFKGAKKLLVLNATNIRTLHEKVGRNAEQLAGKQIKLVVERLPREFNGHQYGIRIRPIDQQQKESK